MKKQNIKMTQKISIRFQTYNKESLKALKKNIEDFALAQSFNFSSINLPVEKKRYTVLKSPHVNKKAKDQFELRFYNGLIILTNYQFCDQILHKLKTYFSSDLLVKISLST